MARCVIFPRGEGPVGHKCGFILDAKMAGKTGGGAERLRVLALPILTCGELTGLQGFKRAA
jgi:hypothetical protein